MNNQLTFDDYFKSSRSVRFNDHKTICWLITEIGFINDSIKRKDITSAARAKAFVQRKIDAAKSDLIKDGITNSVFITYESQNSIGICYEYELPCGYKVKGSGIIPRGPYSV